MMTPTPEQIEAAKELANMMKEKGIRWEWQDKDDYIYQDGNYSVSEGLLPLLPKEALIIPFPDFERCRLLLEDWGYDCFEIACHWGREKSWLFRFRKSAPGLDWIETEAPDPTTCAIKAVAEAVRRK